MISYDCITELNEIINHPDVIEGHLLNDSGEGPLDVSECFERGAFGVIGEGFGFLLDPVAAGVYEVHTSILPEHRRHSRAITMQGMAEVFTQTATMEIVTRIKNNPAARQLAIAAGMRKTFQRGEMEYFSIHISQWAATAIEFIPIGQAFHKQLQDVGVELDHEDDQNHDQYVGIALSMAKAGLIDKAVWFYNLWSKLVGFFHVELIGEDKVFIGDAIIEMIDNEIKVTSCPQAQQ